MGMGRVRQGPLTHRQHQAPGYFPQGGRTASCSSFQMTCLELCPSGVLATPAWPGSMSEPQLSSVHFLAGSSARRFSHFSSLLDGSSGHTARLWPPTAAAIIPTPATAAPARHSCWLGEEAVRLRAVNSSSGRSNARLLHGQTMHRGHYMFIRQKAQAHSISGPARPLNEMEHWRLLQRSWV